MDAMKPPQPGDGVIQTMPDVHPGVEGDKGQGPEKPTRKLDGVQQTQSLGCRGAGDQGRRGPEAQGHEQRAAVTEADVAGRVSPASWPSREERQPRFPRPKGGQSKNRQATLEPAQILQSVR